MIKKITGAILLNTMLIYLMSGCAMIEKTESKTKEIAIVETNQAPLSEPQIYGVHTNDIKVLLDATPIGSEISLQEGMNGEWHLKIEKVFTVENMNHAEVEYYEVPVVEETSNVVLYSSETILI
jgi:hypothetical protein